MCKCVLRLRLLPLHMSPDAIDLDAQALPEVRIGQRIPVMVQKAD